MTRTTRRILFYLMIVLFLLGGTGIVLYAEGWRFDAGTFTAEKVGAIYVQSNPSNATISIDGKSVKNKTGFFQPGTLINGLFPKKYRLTLSLPDHHEWHQTVTVLPALVTEVKEAVLVPQKSTLVVSGNPKNFWILDDAPIIENQSSTLLLQDRAIPGNDVVGWTSDQSHLLTQDLKTGAYYWSDLQNATSVNATLALRRAQNTNRAQGTLMVDPENNTRLLHLSSTSISFFDPARAELTPIATSSMSASTTQTIQTVASSRFWIAWSAYNRRDHTSRVFLYDKFFGGVRNIGGIMRGKVVNAKWANNSILGFFLDDGEFYTYTPGTPEPVHIASDVQDFVFTENAERVVTLGKTDIEIISFRDKDRYWRFNLPEAKRITGLAWYEDNMHLFVSYPGNTAFLELNDKNLEHFEPVAATDKVHYNSETNQFYYLENGRLLRTDFPD